MRQNMVLHYFLRLSWVFPALSCHLGVHESNAMVSIRTIQFVTGAFLCHLKCYISNNNGGNLKTQASLTGLLPCLNTRFNFCAGDHLVHRWYKVPGSMLQYVRSIDWVFAR